MGVPSPGPVAGALRLDAGPDGPGWTDERIAEALDVGRATVERLRKRFVTEGLEAALGRQKARRAHTRRLAERFEFHYTPKHGSRLNMAEIELGVMSRQCLKDHVPSQADLATATSAWEADRNARASTVDWQFRTADARIKLKTLYPSLK